MNEAPVAMAVLALEVIGEFARLQESVDELVSLYVETRARALIDYLESRNVLGPNIQDAQRVRLVVAVAAELETPGDLSRFSDVFHAVKDVRNALAHGARLEQIDANTLRIAKKIWTGPNARPRKGTPTLTVTREELTTHLNNTQWLRQHVHCVIAALKAAWFIGTRRVTHKLPPADPAGWDGILFTELQ